MLDDLYYKLRYKLRSLDLARPFSGLWSNFYFFWHTANKDPLIFVSILGIVTGSFGALLYFSISEKSNIRDLTCLAMNVYHEARSEPKVGQYAVAKVTLNRVASKHYPNTICEVVYQKNWDRIRRRYVSAFSWTELPPVKHFETRAWLKAWKAAKTVYDNPDILNLNGALFYHTKSIKPRWAKQKMPAARIGKHIFY
ncbi:MAG: hypothetical protein BMS9Abin33_0287 [Gammaproteobacteria bacterium]|nr:MAG: hypothetical protein BMS9Abin33_0287 [Gammaproteobacteria bacterium]